MSRKKTSEKRRWHMRPLWVTINPYNTNIIKPLLHFVRFWKSTPVNKVYDICLVLQLVCISIWHIFLNKIDCSAYLRSWNRKLEYPKLKCFTTLEHFYLFIFTTRPYCNHMRKKCRQRVNYLKMKKSEDEDDTKRERRECVSVCMCEFEFECLLFFISRMHQLQLEFQSHKTLSFNIPNSQKSFLNFRSFTIVHIE